MVMGMEVIMTAGTEGEVVAVVVGAVDLIQPERSLLPKRSSVRTTVVSFDDNDVQVCSL